MNDNLPPLRCADCDAVTPSEQAWRCACGGPFELAWSPAFDPTQIARDRWSQWRYGAMLMPPNVPQAAWTTLGEGMTPTVELDWSGQRLMVKLEFLMATASYKDRGSATLVTWLRALNVTAVIEDSSGNAGASLAAYCAAAGLSATIFVPSHAAAGKKVQIERFGATLREVDGPRQATTDACHAAAENSFYASHAWHPAFLLGQMAAAWELWEQGNGLLPDAIVMPLGQGGMLLGYYRGFRALQEAGLINAMPRLVAVQSAACAPVVAAWRNGAATVAAVDEGESIAAGIRIRQPVRGTESLRAIRESEGMALTVSDEAIGAAHQQLARQGLFVEATSAVPMAAVPQIRATWGRDLRLLVPLSGSGLKGSGGSGGS
ncbi:MAG: pyridoxal-phosphate dependent enzyme [Anaerolineales bacterium]|nr:pyridoxal-phosphate dependent enzyme [Anaerolineales bacterium]